VQKFIGQQTFANIVARLKVERDLLKKAVAVLPEKHGEVRMDIGAECGL
jgi:hypothetical protein